MKCLLSEEITNWITRNGQIEDPYIGESEPRFRVQCTAPSNYFAIEYFLRAMMNLGMGEADMLLHATDCEPTEACRDFMFYAMRHEIGEQRPMEEAPGYLLTSSESEKAVAIFAASACFKWKCYLYGSKDQMTLYNWEGDIFDFWTNSEVKASEFRILIKDFKLEEIESEQEIN